MIFVGQIKIIKKDNGHMYWDFEKNEDYKKALMLACRKYGIVSRKHRIRRKYLNKLLSEALRAALKDLDEPKT